MAPSKQAWLYLFRWFKTGENLPPLADPCPIDRLYRWTRFPVLLSVILGYGFLYTCRLPLSVVKKPLIDAGIFDAEVLGRIGSALAVGYAFGRIGRGYRPPSTKPKVSNSKCHLRLC